MSDRDRRFEFGVGVALFSGLFLGFSFGLAQLHNHSNEAESHDPGSYNGGSYSHGLFPSLSGPAPPSRYPEAYVSDEDRNNIDANAQRWMAWSGYWLFWMTTAGVGLLFWTLREARKTTKAAQDTVTATREIGTTQIQAYAQAIDPKVYLVNSEHVHPHVILSIKNSGQTPVKRFTLNGYAECISYEQGTDVPYDRARIYSSSLGDWHGIGTSEVRTVPFHAEGIDDAIRGIIGRSKNLFHIAGVVTYETMNGDIFDSEFHFFSRSLRAYRNERVPDGEMGQTREIPQALSQPETKLRVFWKRPN